MIDRLSPTARLAHGHAQVGIEQPDWTRELMIGLAALGIVVAVGIAALASGVSQVPSGNASRAEVEHWRTRAGGDGDAVIRIHRDAFGRYHCLQANVPRDWRPVIDAQCELLAGVLPITSD